MKSLFIVTLVSIIFLGNTSCGGGTSKKEEAKQENKTVIKKEKTAPEYPGGTMEMFKYISDNLKITGSGIVPQGNIVAKFTVKADGTLENIVIQRGLSDEVNQEAIKVLEKMPKWTPGTINGEAVDMEYTLPFLLNNDTKE